MSRRRAAEKRVILPDTVYNSLVVSKFINLIMRQGKKSIAQKILYGSLKRIAQKIKQDGITVLDTALKNVKPYFEVKSKRVGGSTYQVPIEVRGDRKTTLAIRWLITASKTRNGKSMEEKLSFELIDAFNNKGGAVKKKEEIHKMAEANKAFSHYVWHGR